MFIRCFSQALKYAKPVFWNPGPHWGSLQHSPRPPSQLGKGIPPPHSLPPRRLRHLDLGVLVVWPPTSLKFVHLALRSKRLDTPALVSHLLHCIVVNNV